MSLPFTNEQFAKIAEAIHEHRPRMGHCTSCGGEKLGIVDGFVYFVLQKGGTEFSFDGYGIPALMIQCQTCGTITFKNPILLGLNDLIEKPVAADPDRFREARCKDPSPYADEVCVEPLGHTGQHNSLTTVWQRSSVNAPDLGDAKYE